jgi:hypothetical protein
MTRGAHVSAHVEVKATAEPDRGKEGEGDQRPYQEERERMWA